MAELRVTRHRSAGPLRSYTIHDQVALRRLEDFAPSSDGTRLILQISSVGRGKRRLDTHLWSMNADGRGLRRLTRSGGRNTSPVFAPDGRSVYYLGGRRSAPRQVMRIAFDGEPPAAVTRSPIDIESFRLSPDGTKVAFSTMVFPGGPETLATTARRLQESSHEPASGHIHDRLFIRHWDAWKTGRRSHIFVQAVDGGPVVDVMPAMDADAPVKPFGGREEYTFTPDGDAIVFTARDVGREEAWSTDLDLFQAPIDANMPPRKITTDNRATDRTPAFSPDGTRLAYLAMDRAGYEADKLTVVVRSWPEGPSGRPTDAWDRSVEEFDWSPDGRTLYATADDVGQRGLFAVDVATGSVTPLVHSGTVSRVRAVGNAVYYILDSLDGPADLYSLVDGQHVRLTRLNAATMDGLAIGQAEQFSFAGWQGETVHGYVLRPADFNPDRTYPIAFIVHGGPQSSIGNHWHYRWNAQVYAGAGYAVVMIDFHGSTGYGQAFTDSIRGDWGGKPLEDLKRGYATAIDRFPFLDRDPSRRARRELRRLHGQPHGRRSGTSHGDVSSPTTATSMSGSPTTRPRSSGSRSGSMAARRGITRSGLRASTTPSITSRSGRPDAGDPRGPDYRVSRGRRPGGVHRAAASGGALEAAPFPRREPLGAQASELGAVARDGARVARPLDGARRSGSHIAKQGASPYAE